MAFLLSSSGRSFATRQRAKDLLPNILAHEPGEVVTLDVSDVFASPSFLAELFTLLVAAHRTVRLVRSDTYFGATAGKLVTQLGLEGRVMIEGTALSI